jgi:membrane-bound lytic murein transglycosylase B
LGNKIEFQKKILGSLLREMYYDGSSPELIMTLEAEKFSQFLGGADHLAAVQQKILNLMGEIKYSKEEIEKNKNELKDNQDEQERLLALKQDQQQDLMATRNETQSDINEKEATISELNAKLWKLQGDLSGFLGKSYNAKDIEDAARFASKATGVRKDFIMGMLVVESDLGRFTGGCLAKDSRMSGRRLDLFKDICEELDYNWKKRKVSCPPKGYSGTGGAMGVAQFMSDTWMGYKSQIASVTGHKPPDPWNLTDGVTAMGLKLARGGATKKSGECNAAKLYLSGTTSSKYNWYCQKVLYWADNYERLID